MKKQLKLLAPAKLNLYLKVHHKLKSGYHEISSPIAFLNVYDEVSVTLGEAGSKIELQAQISPELSKHLDFLGQSDEFLDELNSPKNLVFKAASRAAELSGINHSIQIKLLKNIPPQAGLGGGSSDAASVLAALKCLLPESFTEETLFKVASELGSDISAFLAEALEEKGLIFVHGTGNKLAQIRAIDKSWSKLSVILVKPPFGVSTREAYSKLGKRVLEQETSEIEDASKNLSEALGLVFVGGERTELERPYFKAMFNDFEDSVFSVDGRFLVLIDELKSCLAEVGLQGVVRLCGSGSTLALVFEESAKTALLDELVRERISEGCLVFLTKFKEFQGI